LLAVPSGQGPCWLRVPPSWPWLTRQALLREPAGRHVSPGQRALAAAGCWRLQAGPHCDAEPTCARLPQPRDTPHPASPWPHRLTSSALARAATTARALLPCSFSCFNKSFHVHGTLRGAGVAEEALTPLWARACRPSRLKHFSTQICVETCRGCRDQPAR
jgi:hypothetical protein